MAGDKDVYFHYHKSYMYNQGRGGQNYKDDPYSESGGSLVIIRKTINL